MRRRTPSHRFRKFLRNRESAFHPQHDSYRWWLLANIMIGTFMAVLDATIVNVGLPKIMASFGVGIDKIEWVITAYMLSLAVALPTSAWLSDRFGYKLMYFLGMMLFTVGSFLCGLSGNEDILIMSRVIQGLGAGMIMPIGMAIVTREFPPQQRGIALGFWSIASAASVSFGPLIGGFLVDHFNWQLIFDVNIPVGIVGMLATIVIQKEYKNPRRGKFDVWGFISVSIFLPVLLFALSEGSASSNSAGWSNPLILACFAISAIAFISFITAELTVAQPLIDLRLLREYNFAVSNLVVFIFGVGMFGSTFLLPLYLQNSLGYTAIQAGSVFLPVGIIQGIAAPLAGKFSDKINPRIPIILGIILLSLSFYLHSKLSYLSEHSYVMLALYIRGFAMGIMFGPLSAVALRNISREKMAQASGLTNVIRQLGGSFGVAILATILTTRVAYHSQLYGESLQSNSPVYKSVNRNIGYYIQHNAGSSPGKSSQQSQYVLLSNINKQAFVEGVDDDFLIASLISLVSGVPVLFLRLRKKNKNIMPNTISHD